MASTRDIEKIKQLDRELISIIQDFLILGPLSWPIETQREFMQGVARGNLCLPEVTYNKVASDEKIARLKIYLKNLGKDHHPAVAFLRDTAQSYLDAYRILRGVGTKDVSKFSKKLYGCPSDLLGGYKKRNLDIAKYFLRIVDSYHKTISNEPQIYSAEKFRKKLQHLVDPVIKSRKDRVRITVDDSITARATSGPSYVKIRKGTMFSDSDLWQLYHHEVMTHTLTYINGRKQPTLLTLGYASPRITATQEGLAVFSEYINLSIELVRLKRIALRIIAIDMSENGADLIDLFRFFKESGQNDEESYYSSMRIFRGGSPKGGIIFYKDNVYLRGLIEVEAFLKKSMHGGLVHDIAVLFAGKLTTEDVYRLHSLIDEGYVVPPTYLPEWIQKTGELAAHLAINDLTERFIEKKNK